MAEKKNKTLGRGLASLLGESKTNSELMPDLENQKMIPIEFLQPGKYQPRRIMNSNTIAELSESIRQKGIIQPILVRALRVRIDDPVSFEIIAGERRWRAAQLAQLHEVPVIVRNLSDFEALEMALVENLQRQDLSPLEEAEGYERLIKEFGHTQEVLSKGVSKSRSHVANMMRLLILPEEVKVLVDNKSITAGHARALLTSKDPLKIAKTIISDNLNVRETEKLVKSSFNNNNTQKHIKLKKDINIMALERKLSNELGVKAAIFSKGKGGTLSLKYSSLDQLDNLLHKLGLK